MLACNFGHLLKHIVLIRSNLLKSFLRTIISNSNNEKTTQEFEQCIFKANKQSHFHLIKCFILAISSDLLLTFFIVFALILVMMGFIYKETFCLLLNKNEILF